MKTHRISAATLALLANLLLIVGLIVPAAHASPSSDDRADEQPVSTNAPAIQSPRSRSRSIDPAGYWTEEKMRDATPADQAPSAPEQSTAPRLAERSVQTSSGENLSDPVYPTTSPGQVAQRSAAPMTTGKVFYSYGGRDYVCSGAAINGATKNVVATAGHCVHGGKGKGWHSNVVFAPGYNNGVSSHGLWNWKAAHTFTGWMNSSDSSLDQAFFTVHPRNGQNLVDAVGGNGLSYNAGQNHTGVRIWGWPAEYPYQGQRPIYCDGNTRKAGWSSNDMVMPCDMTGGASGGPWLRSRTDANVGYVFGVTSRRTTSGEKLLISTPFNDAVKNLFEGIT